MTTNELRKLDAALARALGWTSVRHSPDANQWAQWRGHNGKRVSPVPHYSTAPAAIRLIEDEIERRTLMNEYVRALDSVLDTLLRDCPESDIEHVDLDDVWHFIRATPEQRARAALAVFSAHQISSSEA